MTTGGGEEIGGGCLLGHGRVCSLDVDATYLDWFLCGKSW